MMGRSVLLVVLTFVGTGSAWGAGIVVGHSNVMNVAVLPQTLMDRVAQFRWFFAHASVGDNMMEGITELHSSDPTRYPLQRVSEDDWPPSWELCNSATVYDCHRGNPDWTDKVAWFEGYASNGWRNPAVHIALNKFCWIDPTVNTNTYFFSMSGLEARYPDTLFVYMTIPLTGDADGENDSRNTFNRALRLFCLNHNRVLFDVADIESHDTNGTAYTYSTTNQLMYGGFAVSPGDWHLNDVARPWVARGFYALGAALLTTDRDGDGQMDGEELLSGMCPTSRVSCFSINASANTNSRFVITWSSASNRVYTLRRTTNLTDAAAYTNLVTNEVAHPPFNIYTDTPSGTGPWFYKVNVR